METGKFNIRTIDTGLFGLDGGSMFGVVPRTLWAKSYSEPDTQHRVPLAARPLLVEWDNKKLLIDTGNGDKWDEKTAKMYGIDVNSSNMEKALSQYGITPAEITDVILTHLHFDHAGGSTKKVGSELIPTFPNAKYYVQKDHFGWAVKPTEKDRASFIPENYTALKEHGVLEFTEGDGELFSGISVIPVFGHTMAMQMVKISDTEETILYCADLMPTSAHVPYPYIIAFDNYPLTTLEEKKKILPQAYEEQWIIVFEHDAFRQAARLIEAKKGFAAGPGIDI